MDRKAARDVLRAETAWDVAVEDALDGNQGWNAAAATARKLAADRHRDIEYRQMGVELHNSPPTIVLKRRADIHDDNTESAPR